jgi:hypothetical protein
LICTLEDHYAVPRDRTSLFYTAELFDYDDRGNRNSSEFLIVLRSCGRIEVTTALIGENHGNPG